MTVPRCVPPVDMSEHAFGEPSHKQLQLNNELKHRPGCEHSAGQSFGTWSLFPIDDFTWRAAE